MSSFTQSIRYMRGRLQPQTGFISAQDTGGMVWIGVMGLKRNTFRLCLTGRLWHPRRTSGAQRRCKSSLVQPAYWSVISVMLTRDHFLCLIVYLSNGNELHHKFLLTLCAHFHVDLISLRRIQFLSDSSSEFLVTIVKFLSCSLFHLN